jgi:pimeloyl-ACP methyl ester carboxylesterase
MDRKVEDSFVDPVINDKGVRRDIAQFLKAADKKDLLATSERYGEIDVPVLLAWGEDAKGFNIKLAERMQRDMPTAELVRIPDSYTFVSLDQPEKLAALI